MELTELLIRVLRGANAATASNRNPETKSRELIIVAGLIEYPGVGLILFETGCAEDLEVVSRPMLLVSCKKLKP
ncbi:hypothetical protein ES702_02402 [subsurface metagenome]